MVKRNLFISAKRRSRGKVRVHGYWENKPHVLGMPQDLVYDILLARDEKTAIKIGQSYVEGRKPWANKYSDTRYFFRPLLPPPAFL